MGQGALEEQLLGASKKNFYKDPRQGGLKKIFLSEKRNLLFRRDYAYPKNKRY